MKKRRIGVYICHCGGNISDYVDVEAVRESLGGDDEVVVRKTTIFACSDAGQEEMIQDIKEQDLDGLVVASCTPSLHQLTFRGTAQRAGLNPYQYVHVNLREQCSWTHTDDRPGATEKAVRLVRGGVANVVRTQPLEPIRIDTVPGVLVIGAGVAGLRNAIAMSDLGMDVTIVEREKEPGGVVRTLEALYPRSVSGAKMIDGLLGEVKARENITLFTEAELVEKAGTVGNFEVTIRVSSGDKIALKVGAIVVATGFDSYQPKEGEYGHGAERVVTLPDFRRMLQQSGESLTVDGRDVSSIAYIYCVGSRQQCIEGGNRYCSRFCCNAALHTSNLVSAKFPETQQFHLHKGMRSYGKHERLFEEAARAKSVFIKFGDDDSPTVLQEDGELRVDVVDLLTSGANLRLEPDLVVLVTGMVPRENAGLVDTLKLPIGRDNFFNEVHPKLRPVETLIDGVFIAGASQGPKDVAESVASSLAASAKVASLLKRGFVELSPLIAKVDVDRCTWCDLCVAACPYGAIDKVEVDGKAVAHVTDALCKGGGSCLPSCPQNALQLEGYTDDQIESMIDSLMLEVAP